MAKKNTEQKQRKASPNGSSFASLFFVLLLSASGFSGWWFYPKATKIVEVAKVGAEPVADGSLIYIVGEFTSEQKLSDKVFAVDVEKAVRLQRKVEVYQWQANADSYKSDWQENWVDSSSFPENYQNTEPFPIVSDKWLAENALLSRYALDPLLVEALPVTKERPFSGEEFAAFRQSLPQEVQSLVWLQEGALYFGRDPMTPEIGDAKVVLTEQVEGMVTVLARLRGNRLIPFEGSGGRMQAIVRPGVVPLEQLRQIVMLPPPHLIEYAYSAVAGFFGFLAVILLLKNIFKRRKNNQKINVKEYQNSDAAAANKLADHVEALAAANIDSSANKKTKNKWFSAKKTADKKDDKKNAKNASLAAASASVAAHEYAYQEPEESHENHGEYNNFSQHEDVSRDINQENFATEEDARYRAEFEPLADELTRAAAQLQERTDFFDDDQRYSSVISPGDERGEEAAILSGLEKQENSDEYSYGAAHEAYPHSEYEENAESLLDENPSDTNSDGGFYAYAAPVDEEKIIDVPLGFSGGELPGENSDADGGTGEWSDNFAEDDYGSGGDSGISGSTSNYQTAEFAEENSEENYANLQPEQISDLGFSMAQDSGGQAITASLQMLEPSSFLQPETSPMNTEMAFAAAPPGFPPGMMQPPPGFPPGMMQPPPGFPPGMMQPPPGFPPGMMQPPPGFPPGMMQPPPGFPPGMMQPPPGFPPGMMQPPPGFPPGMMPPIPNDEDTKI